MVGALVAVVAGLPLPSPGVPGRGGEGEVGEGGAVVGGLFLPPPGVPGLAAQEPAGRDTLPEEAADTLPAEAPGDTLLQEASEARRIQAFPKRLADLTGFAVPVYECDRECLLASPAFSLLELLVGVVPGLTPVRAGYFGGPHHVTQGAILPSSVRIVVDGRELDPLETGQADLLRVSLTYLERVRVARRRGGLVIDVSTHRQDRPVAYSRIEAGTGEPDLQLFRAIFSNRLGGSFTVAGAFDLLNTTLREGENDRFDFWGRLAWMPGTNKFGIEFEFKTEDVFRNTADSLELDRREILVRTRADVTEAFQVEARASTSEFRRDGETIRDVEEVAVTLSGRTGGLLAEGEVRMLDGDAYPELEGTARASVRPVPAVSFDVGGAFASWRDFETEEAWGGLTFRLGPNDLVVLGGDASKGTRGVPRPLEGTADTVSFETLAAEGRVGIPSLHVRGRVSREEVDRVLPFGASFDRLLTPGPSLEVTAVEVGLAAPVFPLGAIIPGASPIRVDGFYRHQDPTGELPLYVPDRLVGGEVFFHDDFFEGALELWLSARLSHRTEMLSAQSTIPDPVVLPEYTWWQGHFSFRIGDFRFFWKLVNPAGLLALEVGGVEFPRQFNVVGVKWEFFN